MIRQIIFVSCALALVLSHSAESASATWNPSPNSNLWLTTENWIPATVPNSESDVATFGSSNITDVMVGDSTTLEGAVVEVSEIVFSPSADSYTITSKAQAQLYYADYLEFYGAGIVNSSGKVQNFVTEAALGPGADDPGEITFMNSSSVGANVVFTNQGSGTNMGALGPYGGATNFGSSGDAPSAGSATFINEGGKVAGTVEGGTTNFFANSTAETATFINEPGLVAGAAAGVTYLDTGGSIGNSVFINNAATVSGAEGGYTELDVGVCSGASFIANGAATAGPQGGQIYSYGGSGNATFTAKGGDGSGSEGGLFQINNMPNSAETIAVAEGGTNGGLGGMIVIEATPTSLDQVQFQLQGNGMLQLASLYRTRSVTVGSLSGAGTVSLSTYTLAIGSNNLATTFSGIISGKGGISKTGTGALTLSGANTYTKGTTISGGSLLVTNATGSGTGTGTVQVTAGSVGGTGIINGAVTLGTGSGSGSVLAPGNAGIGTLTVKKTLIFNSDATYACELDTLAKRSDSVVAKGVTISAGATFSFQPSGTGTIKAGKVFTVIKNTASQAIGGTFANLADGSVLTSGNNKFQVSYKGGNGNDLTLTVQ